MKFNKIHSNSLLQNTISKYKKMLHYTKHVTSICNALIAFLSFNFITLTLNILISNLH